ncbi:MAG: AtpZ/AtpI family protein [Sphingobacteriia bacterium]|nr:AtpZ/AtpI family protein [Sphingobacteriia bacterium]
MNLPNPDPEKNRNPLGKWAGAGMQMAVTILGFVFLGIYLDKNHPDRPPYWTLGLSLAGSVLSIYYMIKTFLQK